MAKKKEGYSSSKMVLYYDKVIELHRQGIKIPEITDLVPVGSSTVYRWLQRALSAPRLIAENTTMEAAVKDDSGTSKEAARTGADNCEMPVSPEISDCKELNRQIRLLQDKLDRSQEEGKVLMEYVERTEPGVDTSVVAEMAKEIQRLNGKLAAAGLTTEAEAAQPEGELTRKDLLKQLQYQTIRADAYSKMIDIAEEKLGVNIRKKLGAKQ